MGEVLAAAVTEIAAEEREPGGEELGGDAEIGGLVAEEEGVVGSDSVEIVVVHGWLT